MFVNGMKYLQEITIFVDIKNNLFVFIFPIVKNKESRRGPWRKLQRVKKDNITILSMKNIFIVPLIIYVINLRTFGKRTLLTEGY